MTATRRLHLLEGLPARALTSEENQALELAMGLAMTPEERLAWLESAVEELTQLCGLARVGGEHEPEAGVRREAAPSTAVTESGAGSVADREG